MRKYPYKLVNALTDLANLYKKTGRFEEAEKAYRRLITICVINKYGGMIAQYYHNLSYIYQQQKKYTEAEKASVLSLQYANKYLKDQDNKMLRQYGRCLYGLALVYFAQKKNSEAIKLCKDAVQILHPLGDDDIVQKLNTLLKKLK